MTGMTHAQATQVAGELKTEWDNWSKMSVEQQAKYGNIFLVYAKE